MAETYEVFNVKKQEFIMSEWTDESQEAISDGEVKLQILQFAYTSNNTTYAVAGDYIGYWKFFPSSVGKDWGIIPCWGLAKVTESQVDTINVGEQFYGFFPMATHLIVQPCQIRPDGFTDVVEHRSNLPVIYNRYVRCEGDPFYDSEKEAEQLLFRPLFTTSFLIDYMLQESSYFGATQIILTSASSKTALGLAHSLKNGSSNQRIIGLTSNRNLDFVKSLGYYDEVLAYDQYDQIKNQPSCIVDFSGNNDLQADLQTLLGDNLKYNCLVGMVHWSERTGEKKQQNKGIMFFAPTYAQNLVKEIGFSAFSEKVSSEFHSFVAQSESWMNILYHENKEALEALHNAITLGKINPKEGHIVKL
ncbi:MAG: hypothetical protein ACJA01_003062 [Saprospiraceae bacterium]|jgi:hypothetical protein